MQQFEYYDCRLMTFHPSAIPTNARSKQTRLLIIHEYNAKVYMYTCMEQRGGVSPLALTPMTTVLIPPLTICIRTMYMNMNACTAHPCLVLVNE